MTRTRVIVIERKTSAGASVLVGSVERGVYEGKVCDERGTRAIGGNGGPVALVLDALQGCHAAGYAVADDLVNDIPRSHRSAHWGSRPSPRRC